MNKYKISIPPGPPNYKEASKKELIEHCNWFMDSMDDRMIMLETLVSSMEGFKKWTADYSELSLDSLSKWYKIVLKTTKKSKNRIESEKSQLNEMYHSSIRNYEFTDKSVSIMIDISLYFGKCFVNNYNEINWICNVNCAKSYGDYGRLVIGTFGKKKILMEPLGIIYVISMNIAEGKRENIMDTYRVWVKSMNE